MGARPTGRRCDLASNRSAAISRVDHGNRIGRRWHSQDHWLLRLAERLAAPDFDKGHGANQRLQPILPRAIGSRSMRKPDVWILQADSARARVLRAPETPEPGAGHAPMVTIFERTPSIGRSGRTWRVYPAGRSHRSEDAAQPSSPTPTQYAKRLEHLPHRLSMTCPSRAGPNSTNWWSARRRGCSAHSVTRRPKAGCAGPYVG